MHSSSSGPDRGGLPSLFFLHFGGPTDGHAPWPGYAEETPGVSPFYLIIVCSTVSDWNELHDTGVSIFCSLYTKCTGKKKKHNPH